MNTSIEKRIKIIIGVALVLVGLMGAVTLYYSTAINKNIEDVIGADIKQERFGQKIKAAFYNMKALEHEFLYYRRVGSEEGRDTAAQSRLESGVDFYLSTITEFQKQKSADRFQEDVKVLLSNVKIYQKEIQSISVEEETLSRVKLLQVARKLSKLREDQDKLINKILSTSSQNFISHQQYMDHLISNANRNLVFLITMALLAGAIIIYLAPQRVTKPIKGYLNAVRELRDLKFETRLPIRDENELSELGEEINKFVDSFVEFDEMKRKKIQFEKRKFQVLADILNLGVVIISIEGEVLSLNAQMAKFLNLNTESFQKKDFHFVRLPDELVDLFEVAIEKKEKFENRMVILTYEKEDEEGEFHDEAVELLVDAGVVRNYVGDVANIILTFEDISAAPQDSIFKRLSFRKQAVL